MLYIVEHTLREYKPRTLHNADTGHVTVAFAVDFSTLGEKLTRKAAGEERYIGIPLDTDPIVAARALWMKVRSAKGRVINVAGNSIATLVRHGWTQERANAYVYTVLSKVHHYLPFEKIVSGGQTGGDIAGGVAGVMLDLETVLTLPKGLRQRHETGPDRDHTEAEIRAQVEYGVQQLQLAKAAQSVTASQSPTLS
jgi:hypothetical protein